MQTDLTDETDTPASGLVCRLLMLMLSLHFNKKKRRLTTLQ